MCDWKPNFDTLNERVNGIDKRLAGETNEVTVITGP